MEPRAKGERCGRREKGRREEEKEGREERRGGGRERVYYRKSWKKDG